MLYPGGVVQVSHNETHISHLFFAANLAYKIKKPVKFDFVDFSTADLRHQACLDEVRLNRRLAPDVYLRIEPLTFGAQGAGLRLAGDGSIVEWLVVMRRLPEMLMLDRALGNGGRIGPVWAQCGPMASALSCPRFAKRTVCP